MSLGSLIISTAYMGLECALAQFARRLNQRFTRPGLVQELICEAIAAAELCACCFELIIGEKFRSALIEYYLLCINQLHSHDDSPSGG